MTKDKDFFGKDITDVIDQACKEFATTQDNLEIEILETGSAGIFGLCRKQAHIRVKEKTQQEKVEPRPVEQEPVADTKPEGQENAALAGDARHEQKEDDSAESAKTTNTANDDVEIKKEIPSAKGGGRGATESAEMSYEEPSQEALDAIQATISEMLSLMKFPSQVDVTFEGNTVTCNINGEYEEDIIGSEGRTLDSLQYLIRKMMLQSLPDRFLLSLNAGDFRQRRAEDLKQRAVELAEKVKEDGKTQAIPALNPSERRIVHMILQEDKGIRSRSVGDGLFKKVLIYKPGKGRRSGSRKKRG
ncbi:Jag N-terminal domain-containing protein [Desulfogranum marinum]|uniref:Jag family protein n=1 Tax=Desulfogranum marinum TaxID=453220 RepID=UPI00196289C0|nr:Jag N-terminal domain-containing protein [Desulfogranum marinum]MBM9511410.1 Jag N-terminal domain-containing protein [Desulfogranum marinum]